MTSEQEIQRIHETLNRHGQGHLLAFWEQLDADQKSRLIAQIERLDFEQIEKWVEQYVLKEPAPPVQSGFEPAPYYPASPQDEKQRARYEQARRLGRELISAGKVAAFVVAGGQGTRLGFDGPKGNFPVSPVKNKTLFEIFAETIIAAGKKYGSRCPWYIMTSPLNHAQTEAIFASADYFGLEKEDVFIFEQGTLPTFSFDGKVLLADKDLIACSPDGHGGSLKALYDSGATEHMKSRGIELVSYFQVDNPLVNIFDPLFIGLHAADGAEMSSKGLRKAEPMEKVGNFCLVDGKVTVIEYSDLSEELANKRNPDGSLFFELGSIAIHIINTAFIEKLNRRGSSLPLHRAVKKIPHIEPDGTYVEPTEPNGIKLERFVFDALPLAEKSVILETLRSEEFAPVKNATGIDSAESCRRMMVARAAAWLEWAGVNVPRKPDGSPDCLIEIAPGFALHKEDLKDKVGRIGQITPGQSLYLA